MRPEDAEPLAVGGGRAHRNTGGAVGVICHPPISGGCADPTRPSVAFDVGVAEVSEALAGGLAGGDGGEAPLHVAAVGLHVHGRQGLDGGSLGGIQVPQRDQVIGEGSRLVAGPGVERGDELRLLDQAGLQGEQAEEEVAVGGH